MYVYVVTKGLEKKAAIIIIIQLKYTIQGITEIPAPQEQVYFPRRSRGKYTSLRGTRIPQWYTITVLLYQYQQAIRKSSN